MTTDFISETSTYRKLSRFLMAGLFLACLSFCAVSFSPEAKASPAVVDQYTEQVPSPGGEENPGNSNSSVQKDNRGKALSGPGQAQDSTFEAAGQQSASNGASGGVAPEPSSKQKTGVAAGNGDSSSFPVTSVVSGLAAEGGEGMGIFFPLILIGTLLIVGTVFLVRWQGATGSGRGNVE